MEVGRARRFGRGLRRAAPWLVAATVVVILLGRYSAADVGRHMARPGALLVLPILLATCLVSLAALALGDRQTVPRAMGAEGAADGGRLRARDLARARAGTAVLIGLHHGASAGGYGVWLARRTGGDLRVGLGAIAHLTAIDLGAGCVAALVAAWLGGAAEVSRAPPAARVAAAIVVGLVVAAGLFGRRAMGPTALGRWLHDPRLTAAWLRVPPARYFAALALRLLNVGIWIGGTFAAARAFGLPLSFAVMAANLPLVALVAALPASVGGFGAAQLAWVAAFEPWADGASVLAFQLVLQWSATLAFALRGAPFVRRVVAEIADGAPAAADGGRTAAP